MSFPKSKTKAEFKIKLYVSIFPTDKFDWDCIKIDVDKKVLYIKHLFEFHSSVNNKKIPKFWCFKTNGIFLNCCPDEIYSSVTNQIFDQMSRGIDHTVMSYGQNYSGKSFTMSGFYNQYELRGVLPRFVEDLFKHLEDNLEDYAFKVCMSVVDIHQSFIYDLLSHPRNVCKELKDVKEVEVSSKIECLKLLFKAEAQRVVIGNKSYNSHSSTNVVTVTVKLISVNSYEPVDKMSKIHFVDLAGVETIFRNPLTSFKDKYNQGDANVTKTLLELFALRSYENNQGKSKVNQNIHLLTRYLDKSLTSASCISLICHIRPFHEDIKITLSALKFGHICQGIPMGKPQEHTEINHDMTLQKLTEEIKNLKDELLIVNLTTQKSPIIISHERIDFIKRSVQSYLNEELSENDLLSIVDDPNLILNVIKSIHNKPIPRASATIQTDFQQPSVLAQPIKQESYKEETTSKRQSVPKKVSIKSAQKEQSGKGKDAVKSKASEKIVSQSEKTQVNLIEPNAMLPSVDSREGLWAMFLITRPDIHERLERLNRGVAEKNKKLNNESTTYDNINQSVNKTQVALNQMLTYRHMSRQENYDPEGKTEVTEEESELVQKLRQLQRDLEQSKQRLIDAQFDWLEALEKLNDEKQVVEEYFKTFCSENNFVAIDNKIILEEDIRAKEIESITSERTTDIDIKKIYQGLQKKYLHKLTL